MTPSDTWRFRPPRRHPKSSFRQIGDEGGLVVIPGRAEVKVLNPVGIHLWGLLDGSRSIEQLIAAVQNEFEVDTAEAQAGVRAFLEELEEHGMLDTEEARA